jgi:DNA-binding transcriptional LysR family regulator
MKLTALDLRTFAAIVDLGGISAAARKLGLQKSSVSRDLAALEARLGARLFQRTTRRIALTEAGEVLSAYAHRVVEELENAEAAVSALHDAPRGHLAVTAPYAFVRHILAPRLASFHSRFPDLRVSLTPTIRNLDLIEEGMDVAIRVGDLPPTSLIARRLAETQLVLVASNDYARVHGLPATPADLGRHCLIDLRTTAPENRWQVTGATGEVVTCPVSPWLAIGEPSILLDLVEQGVGIGAVPYVYAADPMAAGRIVRVLPGFHRGLRPIHAIYPSRRLLTPKVRAFVDFAEACLRGHHNGLAPDQAGQAHRCGHDGADDVAALT